MSEHQKTPQIFLEKKDYQQLNQIPLVALLIHPDLSYICQSEHEPGRCTSDQRRLLDNILRQSMQTQMQNRLRCRY